LLFACSTVDLLRCLIGGDPVTVYDGGIVLKDKSGIFTKIVSFLSSKESPNRQAGFDPMLPNWVEEVWKGSDIERLRKWINQVKDRQLYVLSGCNPLPDYKKSSQKDVDQVNIFSKPTKDFQKKKMFNSFCSLSQL